MKNIKILALIISMFVTSNLISSEFNANITVSADSGRSIFRNTYFGVNYKATNTIDTSLGEFTMPKPFDWSLSSSFKVYDPDLQLTNYTYKDYRPEINGDKDSIVYQLKISGTNNFNKFTIKWSGLPKDYNSIYLKSRFFSSSFLDNVNMKAMDSVVVENTILDEFYIVIKKNNSSVEELLNNDIRLFPNPTSGLINIDYDNIISLSVIDINGKDVTNYTKINNSILDVSQLNNSAYYLIVNLKNGETKKNLFIKK